MENQIQVDESSFCVVFDILPFFKEVLPFVVLNPFMLNFL